MASPQADAFHAMVRAYREAALGGGGAATPTIDEMRAGSEATLEQVGVMPEGVTITDLTVANDRAAIWIDGPGAVTDAVVLFLHGGGYIMNSIRSHAKLAAGIGVAAGCRVLSLDYRMAPENPFPAAVDDALAAYRWLLDQGFSASRIAIAGDSAGGGLAVATALAAREAGLAQPAALVTMSPWTDLEGVGATMTSHAELDLMIDGTSMVNVALMYVAGADVRNPLIAPIYGDLTGLAPLYIQVGGHEVLLDDSTRLAVRAAHHGVDVRLDVFPEMQHVFQSALGMLPESDDAIRRIGNYLGEHLGISS
jgi:acetyl esterase/lipase